MSYLNSAAAGRPLATKKGGKWIIVHGRQVQNNDRKQFSTIKCKNGVGVLCQWNACSY